MACRYVGYNRGVNHSQSLHALRFQIRIHDAVWRPFPRHCRGSDPVIIGLHAVTQGNFPLIGGRGVWVHEGCVDQVLVPLGPGEESLCEAESLFHRLDIVGSFEESIINERVVEGVGRAECDGASLGSQEGWLALCTRF